MWFITVHVIVSSIGAAMAVSIDRVSLTSALGQALGRTNESKCTGVM